MSVLQGLVDSPVGLLRLAADDACLRLIEFPDPRHPAPQDDDWQEGDNAVLAMTRAQLGEYFAGRRRIFDLPLAPRGTPFQLDVWMALRAIPYGVTIRYRDLAERVGKPSAMRAVGAANGRNPLPIVVPCHRVIGADGSLTGFGGGLPTKRFLLQLEGAMAGEEDLFGLAPDGGQARRTLGARR
ncbi:MAG: methylated-DNA--[protein]-cysteine S-methyltransferase [Lysobacter sp.]|nr:methylated-DNA--[protein]-cysteine S-methyltransferase [Lysobacter sp.]